MNSNTLLALGIIFVIVGIVFAVFSFFIKNSPASAIPLNKCGGTIFFVIGFLTIVVGILGIGFHKEATRNAVQIVALLYILILMILIFIFTLIMNSANKKAKK
jgi:hypothetical protein